MIDSLKQALSQAWLGTAIGALSIIVAIVIYRASAIGARPVYSRRSFRVIGFNRNEFMEDVQILYRGMHVDRLSRSNIIFWNSGKKTLYGSDIVADDAVRCELSPDALVLEVWIIKRTRDANKFTAMIDDNSPNRAILNFDYLDPQDGVVIELLHTDSGRQPAVKGTIRGVPKGMLDRGSPPSMGGILRISKMRTFGKGVGTGMLLVGLICIAYALGASDYLLKSVDKPEFTFFTRLLLLIAGVIYVWSAGVFLFSFRRRYPKTLRYTDDVMPT
jgi:hypothetical protein